MQTGQIPELSSQQRNKRYAVPCKDQNKDHSTSQEERPRKFHRTCNEMYFSWNSVDKGDDKKFFGSYIWTFYHSSRDLVTIEDNPTSAAGDLTAFNNIAEKHQLV